jgi:hypothetical protein
VEDIHHNIRGKEEELPYDAPMREIVTGVSILSNWKVVKRGSGEEENFGRYYLRKPVKLF